MPSGRATSTIALVMSMSAREARRIRSLL